MGFIDIAYEKLDSLLSNWSRKLNEDILERPEHLEHDASIKFAHRPLGRTINGITPQIANAIFNGGLVTGWSIFSRKQGFMPMDLSFQAGHFTSP